MDTSGGWRIAYPIRIGYGYTLDTPRIRFEPYPKKSDTYRLGYEYPTCLGRVFERETTGRREEVRGGGAAAGGWAPSTAAEARHSACASRRRAAGWPRRQRGADRELAGGAAVRRPPDLGLPSLAALALLPSPEREGGGSSPEQLGAAVARCGGRRMGAPAASALAAPAAGRPGHEGGRGREIESRGGRERRSRGRETTGSSLWVEEIRFGLFLFCPFLFLIIIEHMNIRIYNAF